jgi:N-acetyl-gamma-glutamyl-phosphate reductase
MGKIKVGIVGGSGYTGGELLRLLLLHKKVEIIKITSTTFQNKPVCAVHKNLQNFTDLKFVSEPIEKIADEIDLLFFCLPHGISASKVPKAIGKSKIIDLSGDFRLKNYELYEKFYNIKHPHRNLLKKSVYGLPEFNKELITKSNFIANPGCFPTGSLLGLLPLAKEELINDKVIINAVTGSSGSGRLPTQVTHHPERSQNFKAYNTFKHRHEPEILQELSKYSHNFDLVFCPHSAPLSRGIFTTSCVFLENETTEEAIKKIYVKYYENEFFVRLVNEVQLKVVKDTNFCDLAFNVSGNKVIVFTAIDNLVKGASGQAVQNMNLMFNFDEKMGLLFPGTIP